jgi:hypothetical protein
VSQIVVMGNPAPAVLDPAVGAELIVVGSRGHGTFRATPLGSVSHTVMLHATCPVVVVRDTAEQSGAGAQRRIERKGQSGDPRQAAAAGSYPQAAKAI